MKNPRSVISLRLRHFGALFRDGQDAIDQTDADEPAGPGLVAQFFSRCFYRSKVREVDDEFADQITRLFCQGTAIGIGRNNYPGVGSIKRNANDLYYCFSRRARSSAGDRKIAGLIRWIKHIEVESSESRFRDLEADLNARRVWGGSGNSFKKCAQCKLSSINSPSRNNRAAQQVRHVTHSRAQDNHRP